MNQKSENIRNFSIIAHIDHGKSTLADRMLELTSTVEDRKMQDQMLDTMELERERGITIKMQPVRMIYRPSTSSSAALRDPADSGTVSVNTFSSSASPRLASEAPKADKQGEEYVLNLIDTPGHIDFSYEVSRALKAVEGSILLVDATKGVQAQTLTTLGMAQELGNTIIPVVSKIDSPLARTEEVKKEIAELLKCSAADVLEVSGKTGEGVEHLLAEIVKRVAPPKTEAEGMEKAGQSKANTSEKLRALVFDFEYSNHRGIVLYVRIFDGSVKKGANLFLSQAKARFISGEVGIFHPNQVPTEKLSAGEIGYIVTGVKSPGIANVGDTVVDFGSSLPPLLGYEEPRPVVWASVYPESQDDFNELKQALLKLKLSDSSLTFEEEASGTLGRGYRCGFLGMLHLEIVTERLHREFGLELIVATPSITYEVEYKGGRKEMVYSPTLFPDHGTYERVLEPWVKVKIFTPMDTLGQVLQLLYQHEAETGKTDVFGEDTAEVEASMPLRELMRNFFDELKSVTSGYASLSYRDEGFREAHVARLDLLVAEEPVPAFSRVISERQVEEEAVDAVTKLHEILPKQLFTVKIQGKAMGRIISSKTLQAMRKDVTAKLYGGDVTRKRKLLEKQKKGKKRMKSGGKVNIPSAVFLKMMKK
ncbi:MAG TPA: translation elongation factor 4 [Candidatus Paceibacterota bacterium]|nr:translation elongation factor 4 [Candidatus Paceibacterota bacterium]